MFGVFKTEPLGKVIVCYSRVKLKQGDQKEYTQFEVCITKLERHDGT